MAHEARIAIRCDDCGQETLGFLVPPAISGAPWKIVVYDDRHGRRHQVSLSVDDIAKMCQPVPR